MGQVQLAAYRSKPSFFEKRFEFRDELRSLAIRLVPFRTLNLEQAIEFRTDDEYAEVTPKSFPPPQEGPPFSRPGGPPADVF
jgi:hypothetical protein